MQQQLSNIAPEMPFLPNTHIQTLISACPMLNRLLSAILTATQQNFAKVPLFFYLEDGFYALVGAGGGGCLFHIINTYEHAIKMSPECLWQSMNHDHLISCVQSEDWAHTFFL